MPFANPQYLVETDWLEEHLNDPELRVLDCTTILRPDDRGTLQADSGRDGYVREHIPGAGYADLAGDLSDRNTKLRFMMPPAPQFAEAMSRYGVGEGTRVVAVRLRDRLVGDAHLVDAPRVRVRQHSYSQWRSDQVEE